MTRIVTAHTEECFMLSKCVCPSAEQVPWPSVEKSLTAIIDDQGDFITDLRATNFRLRRDLTSWRNTAAICIVLTAGSVGVTALRVLGWI